MAVSVLAAIEPGATTIRSASVSRPRGATAGVPASRDRAAGSLSAVRRAVAGPPARDPELGPSTGWAGKMLRPTAMPSSADTAAATGIERAIPRTDRSVPLPRYDLTRSTLSPQTYHLQPIRQIPRLHNTTSIIQPNGHTAALLTLDADSTFPGPRLHALPFGHPDLFQLTRRWRAFHFRYDPGTCLRQIG